MECQVGVKAVAEGNSFTTCNEPKTSLKPRLRVSGALTLIASVLNSAGDTCAHQYLLAWLQMGPIPQPAKHMHPSTLAQGLNQKHGRPGLPHTCFAMAVRGK